jgi:Spy/CpxP family protein refolding chaperone
MKLSICLAALVAATAATAMAQVSALNVKLGLWEITSRSQSSGAPAIDTSKMTADQRARIEAAMKARGSAGQTPRTRKTCITKEKLASDGFQEQSPDSSCKKTMVTRTATVEEMKIECTGERASTSQVRFEAASPDTVNGTMKVTTTRNGAQMGIDIAISGKWLGADCGDVK